MKETKYFVRSIQLIYVFILTAATAIPEKLPLVLARISTDEGMSFPWKRTQKS